MTCSTESKALEIECGQSKEGVIVVIIDGKINYKTEHDVN